MSNLIEIKVPDIGDFSDVDVIDVLVKAGDTVAVDDALITLESDKASMDIPSPQAGKVKELKIAVGDKVSEGTLVCVLEAEGLRSPRSPRQRHPSQAVAPTCSARCWCWAPAPVATRPRSVRPTWA